MEANEKDRVNADAAQPSVAAAAPAAVAAATVAPARAIMRDPKTGHTVEATQEELVGLMYRGYAQVQSKATHL